MINSTQSFLPLLCNCYSTDKGNYFRGAHSVNDRIAGCYLLSQSRCIITNSLPPMEQKNFRDLGAAAAALIYGIVYIAVMIRKRVEKVSGLGKECGIFISLLRHIFQLGCSH